MEDVIQVQDQFYILATSRADDRTRVLKHGETFTVFDRYGDIVPFGLRRARPIPRGNPFPLALGNEAGQGPSPPAQLLCEGKQRPVRGGPDQPRHSSGGRSVIPRGTLHVFRARFLWQGACYERLRVSNHGLAPIEVSLVVLFDADFADIFEVRGRSARDGASVCPSG